LPSNKCQIRKCTKEKNVENCAHCFDYACARLDAIFKTDPAAKRRLDEIKNEIR
jgi:hypothetical protein